MILNFVHLCAFCVFCAFLYEIFVHFKCIFFVHYNAQLVHFSPLLEKIFPYTGYKSILIDLLVMISQ
jgi:hypothetical protein